MKHYCLTCERELKPQTSIPRWAKYEQYAEKRKEYVKARQYEIQNGQLGYLKESEFCNKDCASFYGRVAARYAKTDTTLKACLRRVLDLYGWVQERKPKLKAKQPAWNNTEQL